jgi:hypothetical protein
MENAIPTGEEIRLERFKVKISLFKFILGTIILGVASTSIKYLHDERELKLKEFESIGSYVKYALAEDRKAKKDFSQYFAIMSNHPDFSAKWQAYDSIVNIELGDYLREQQRSFDILLRVQKDALIDSMKRRCVNTKLPQQEIINMKKDSVTRQKKTIGAEFNIVDVNAKILSLPVDIKKADKNAMNIETVEALAGDALAKSIVSLLQQYESYCFNSARIRDWGGKKRAYRTLKAYDYEQINAMLVRLLSAKILVTGNCENPQLFQFNTAFDRTDLFR